MKESIKWSMILLGVLLSFSITIILVNTIYDANLSDEETVVALYSDEGTWEESVQAARNMFLWMNYTVVLVDADHINIQGLDNFDVLCIPGGSMYQYAQDISPNGMDNIRYFINNGGSYIGICGGAYYAAEEVIWQGEQLPITPLGIFPGTAEGPNNGIAPFPNYTICKINILNSSHPITQSLSDSVWMLYYWGPMFTPNIGADITVLGNYDIGNRSAMIAFDYGLGRVFLIGTHPEIEEDSDRDGVAFADELDDQGSDWDLMREATLWCLKE
ncbi:MAG: BPL-N domain-containing protein [Candidatus Hodarchaeota archaeon]